MTCFEADPLQSTHRRTAVGHMKRCGYATPNAMDRVAS